MFTYNNQIICYICNDTQAVQVLYVTYSRTTTDNHSTWRQWTFLAPWPCLPVKARNCLLSFKICWISTSAICTMIAAYYRYDSWMYVWLLMLSFRNHNYNFEYVIALLWPVPVAAQSKAQVCGRSPAEIVGSNQSASSRTIRLCSRQRRHSCDVSIGAVKVKSGDNSVEVGQPSELNREDHE